MKLLAFALCSVALSAAEPSKKVTIFSADRVAAQIVQGGGWATDIFLVNASDVPGKAILQFFSGDGKAWSPNIVGLGTAAKFTIALSAGTSRRLTLADTGGLQQGWLYLNEEYDASLPSDQRYDFTVGGMATFRAGWNEATVPLASEFADDSLLFFRAAGGYATGIAIVNPSDFSSETVRLTFRDDDGAILASDIFDMKPLNKLVVNIVERYPQLAGRSGTVRVQAGKWGVASLALIFNPGGFFTSAHSLEPL